MLAKLPTLAAEKRTISGAKSSKPPHGASQYRFVPNLYLYPIE